MPLRFPLSRRSFLIRGASLSGLAAASCSDEPESVQGDPDADSFADTGADVNADAAVDAGEPGDAVGTDTADGSAPGPDAAACTGSVTISMVHVNDIHSNYSPDASGVSPVSRIVGYHRSVLATNPLTIFTNAGDDFEKGAVAEAMSGGIATLDITRAMGFDVRCIGNHDFAWSEDVMLDFSDDPTAATISSNVGYTGPTPERWKAREFVIREVDCLRIGYFGMVGQPWNEFNEQYEGNFFENFPMRHDYVERATELVNEYRSQVDILIMCSHLGLGLDRLIAEAVPGIDIILGGHSHSIVNPEQIVGETIIIQAGSSAQFIAHLDVDVDRETREITGYRYELLLNSPGVVPVDEDMDRMVTEILTRTAPNWAEVVGTASRRLDAADMAQVMSEAAAQVLNADAAFTDRGTAWVAVGSGDVTAQDFINCFTVERQPAGTPGYNSYGVASVSGAVLRQMQANVDPEWGAAGPTEIDDTATYSVALQRHVAGRTGRYFGDGAVISDYTLADECFAILSEYARQRATEGLSIDRD
jgi:5'-nucleotidase/UDP-sugar diphosphatase